MMTKAESLEKMREVGAYDAATLRDEAAAGTVTETEIIDREMSVPAFDPSKDYTSWPVNSPVQDEGQVWLLLQPYNAAHYEGRPETLRALWGLCHTTNPAKAKPWVDPYGTSGMYMTGECYKDENGVVWRCKRDDVVYDAAAMPDWWERVEVA